MGGLGLGARAATAGRRLRGRRGGSAAGGGTWPRGWLLKLVPFFLRTWTLLRLSRGNSDSLSAYLRPPHPPSPRPSSPPFPSLETLMDTSEGSADTDVGRVCSSRGQPGSWRRDGSLEIKAGAVQPCLPCALRATGRVEGSGGRGPGTGPTAWRTRRPPSFRPLHPAPHPRPAFLQLWGVCAPTFSEVTLPLSSDSGEGWKGVPFVGGWTWSPEEPHCWKGEMRPGGSGPPAPGRMGFASRPDRPSHRRNLRPPGHSLLRLILNRGFGDYLTLRSDCNWPTWTPLSLAASSWDCMESPPSPFQVSSLPPPLLHRLLVWIYQLHPKPKLESPKPTHPSSPLCPFTDPTLNRKRPNTSLLLSTSWRKTLGHLEGLLIWVWDIGCLLW